MFRILVTELALLHSIFSWSLSMLSILNELFSFVADRRGGALLRPVVGRSKLSSLSESSIAMKRQIASNARSEFGCENEEKSPT